jgi:outer membrane protein assembly factor BamB
VSARNPSPGARNPSPGPSPLAGRGVSAALCKASHVPPALPAGRGARGVGLLALAAALSLSAGCAGSMTIHRFTTEWVDDSGKSMDLIQKKLAHSHPAAGADVAVAVAGDANKLIGAPLAGGAKWSFTHAIDARPIVTGSIVVATGAGEIFALDANSGKKLWARPTGGLKIHGAGDDGTVTVISMASGAGLGSVLLAVARDGNVLQQLETERVLGTPAVLGGFAFVPWNNVYVSAINLASGNEDARLVVREQTSRAWTQSNELYFGEIGIIRFDDKIKLADRSEATHVALPTRELAGSPKLMEPGTENPGPVAEARDRIRIYARPTAGDSQPLGIDSDRYYATYFKLVMGLTASKGALAWVHTHASDVIGGAAATGAVVICDEQGHVTVLDAATGGANGDIELGEPVSSCVVQADTFKPAGSPASVPSLGAQISTALLNRDAELATAKRLLLRELAALTDDTATKTLIELASDERTSPMILDDARKALADRRNGAAYMMEALAQHYDFMKDVLRPPPVGPMAQALAAMGAKDAAPLLASHLLDPADTDDDVRRAAEALVKLAGPEQAPQLTQFFAIYRGAAPHEDIETAVVSVAQALARVGGKDGQARIAAAMQDGMTLPNVRERLSALVGAGGK